MMKVIVKDTSVEMGQEAGKKAAALIRKAIAEKGSANIILATGSSQFSVLDQLTAEKGIDWTVVTMFHLDEYIGLSDSHKASFRRYLRERFAERVGPLKAANYINGQADPGLECDRLGALIRQSPIDVALAGIGENGHLAFNDPPADFDTTDPYIIADLDEVCRQQQVSEGWFFSLEEVPHKAISMSVKQVMLSKHIICSVPDLRKANAVKNTVEHEVSNLHPASILQNHPDCYLYLDKASASLLSKNAM